MTWLWLTVPAFFLWLAILILPWRPWSTHERLAADHGLHLALDQITVLIPARNEAAGIATTLAALARQEPRLRVIVIDDGSQDGTADVARSAGLPGLRVIESSPPPYGWSGKLWALEQGRREARTDLTLLLDADIELAPGMLATLLGKLEREDLQMTSVMAALQMRHSREKFLLPAFIYFFKLLYPFALVNRPGSPVAAAAGGCVLLRTAWLERIDGFASIRNELIDDCALAHRIKAAGGRIWLGLSRDVASHRSYNTLADIWNTVARTAYTQLRHSPIRLLACTLIMLVAFLVPVCGAVMADPASRALAAGALAAMIATYLPCIRFYGLNLLWGLTLPAAALLFLVMTWDSAWRHWRGQGAIWKGRRYMAPGH
jgi:hopene-associated glycosyltransferase HpnB